MDKETVCGDNSENVNFGALMNNQSGEYFSEEASLPDLRSPFSAIDSQSELDFDQMTIPTIPQKVTRLPVDEEPEQLASFRQETTNKAVQALVDKETLTRPDERIKEDDEMVSRAQLCQLFEQFIGQLKGDSAPAVIHNDLAVTEAQNATVKISPISVNDRTEEIDQLKSLLIEAQETIIKLLTDRVEDRAKIAALETEVRLLPGPRLTAEEQARLVVERDELKKELAKARIEFDQLDRAHANFKLKQKRPPIWLSVWQFLMQKPE